MALTYPRPGIRLAPSPAPIPSPAPAAPRAARVRTHVLPSRGAIVEHGSRLAIVVAVACVAIFLDASTSYESSTALPYIQSVIVATPDQGSWVVTLFNAAYESSILTSPWFLTRFGRRTYFVASLSAFALSSLGCALASDYSLFLALRLIEGFALGGFFACGVLSLFMSIPENLRLFGIMLFSMSSQMGSALGPAFAGYLVYDDAWQWVFVIDALIALATAVAIGFVLRDPEPPKRVPFDLAGAALIGACFLALQYVVNEGERRNWTEDGWVTLALVIAPVCGAALLAWKHFFSTNPFLDFRVLRHRNLVIGAIFGFGFGILLQAASQIGGFVEETLQFTPVLGGGLDAVRAAAIAVIVPIVTFAIAEKWLGVRTALLLGLGATFVGFRLEVLVTTTDSDFGSFVLPFAGIGIGIAILYRALASVIFGSLPREDLVMGLLVYKMSGVLGGALAGPMLVTMLDHLTVAHRSDAAAAVTLGSAPVRTFLQQGGGSVAELGRLVTEQATTLAYSDLWSFASLVVLGLVPVVFFLDMRAPEPEPAD